MKLLMFLLLQACGTEVHGIFNALVVSGNLIASRQILARFFTAFGGDF